MSYFTEEERTYMDYLDEVYGVEGYGLLMRKGDPVAFELGLEEYEQEEESRNLTSEGSSND